jgi:hypothetical protein
MRARTRTPTCARSLASLSTLSAASGLTSHTASADYSEQCDRILKGPASGNCDAFRARGTVVTLRKPLCAARSRCDRSGCCSASAGRCCGRRSDPDRTRSPETRLGIKLTGSLLPSLANADTSTRQHCIQRKAARKKKSQWPAGTPQAHHSRWACNGRTPKLPRLERRHPLGCR